MRVLVSGSRDWPSTDLEVTARGWLLNRINELPDDTVVIHGGATGVDRIAGELATRRGLFVASVSVGPQHYKRHGRKAPILRNRAMLDLLQAGDVVIAAQYAGSRGTQYTVDEARRRGFEVAFRRWLPVEAA